MSWISVNIDSNAIRKGPRISTRVIAIKRAREHGGKDGQEYASGDGAHISGNMRTTGRESIFSKLPSLDGHPYIDDVKKRATRGIKNDRFRTSPRKICGSSFRNRHPPRRCGRGSGITSGLISTRKKIIDRKSTDRFIKHPFFIDGSRTPIHSHSRDMALSHDQRRS